MKKLIELREIVSIINGNSLFNGLNLIIEENKIYGIVGPRGSGKTLLLSIVSLGIKANGGKIFKTSVNNSDGIWQFFLEKIFWDYKGMSAYNNIRYLLLLSGKDRIKKLNQSLQRAQLIHLIKSKAGFDEISSFDKIKLEICLMNLLQPQLLLMDEPLLRDLDQDQFNFIKEYLNELKNQGTSIIIAQETAHQLRELADSVLKFSKGKLVDIDYEEKQEIVSEVKQAYLFVFEVENLNDARVLITPDLFDVVYIWNSRIVVETQEISEKIKKLFNENNILIKRILSFEKETNLNAVRGLFDE